MNNDGLKQTRYEVVDRIETDLFTKVTVSLLYDEHLKKIEKENSMKKKGIITNNVKKGGNARKQGTYWKGANKKQKTNNLIHRRKW